MPSSNQGLPATISSTVRGTPRSAVAARLTSPPAPRGREAGDAMLSTIQASEAPIPGLKGRDRLEEMDLLEVRPVDVGEVQLRVGDLPQEEVAEPLLAPGADQEIRVGQIRRKEKPTQHLLGDILRAHVPRRRGPRQPARRLGQLPAA